MKKKIDKKVEIGGKTLTLTTGRLAEQADGAVLASYGETVVLATIVSKDLDREMDYFPLTLEYQERLYAGGRIKGSKWVKREGRPSDEEILTGRLIDRSLRPLFPKTYRKEVQVIITVLSVDLENDPSILAGVAASAAAAISPIPWKGPVGIVKVGLREGKYLINPTESDMETSEMDLVVSSTKEAVVMIEAGAKEVTEKDMLGGIKEAKDEAQKIIKLIEDLAKEYGTKKEVFAEVKPPAALVSEVKKLTKDKIPGIVKNLSQGGRMGDYNEMIASVKDQFDNDEEKKFAGDIVHSLETQYMRELILKGKRVDGRKLDEIRTLSAEVGVLPRTHGSAIFARGLTQVLTVATLGAPSLGQLIESAEGEEEKQYMHHYSMPPYSVGETGRMFGPSRREIGHGALAERALIPVIPAEEIFPYAIRVVTEVMSSNGSTSMASVCGSTLSLMDAGVPLTSPVSGIAMGLVIEDEKNYSILSDIMGIEDFNGDMDFKVAGTEKGITALQLDVKTLKLTPSILEKAFEQAKEGRSHILKFMLKTIGKARESVSSHAPKIKLIKIPVEKIGELIGPGGRNIKKLIAETGAQVDVNDDGVVFISADTDEAVKTGIERIEAMTKDPVAGEIYEGEVKRLQPFGAFVEILPGKDGLVHVSDMSEEFVKDPGDIVKLGQKVQVRVKEIDDMGRLNLSMMLDPAFDEKKQERRNGGGSGGGGMRSDNRRGGGGGYSGRGGGQQRSSSSYRRNDRGGGGNDRRGQGSGGSGGPHFPASRFVKDNKEGGFRK